MCQAKLDSLKDTKEYEDLLDKELKAQDLVRAAKNPAGDDVVNPLQMYLNLMDTDSAY